MLTIEKAEDKDYRLDCNGNQFHLAKSASTLKKIIDELD